MRVFETIKAAVAPRQAAEHYGLRVLPNGMACCPFHKDRHPSMKLNEDYFFCFGCGASGDVIDFTSRLFGLSPCAAAKKLEIDFGIGAEHEPLLFPTYAEPPRDREQLCFVFSGTICGTFVSGNCGIVLRSRETSFIPVFPRR